MIEKLVVRQRQYAFLTKESGISGFITRNILVCTVLFGIDKNSGVAFLVHFDLPYSTNKLPEIIEEAVSKSGKDANFELEIFNGNIFICILFLFSAFVTRFFLYRNIKKCRNVSIKKDHLFLIARFRRSVEYSSKNSELTIKKYYIHTGNKDGPVSKSIEKTPGSA